MTLPSDVQSSYVTPELIIPDDWDQAKLILTDYLSRMAYAVNSREIAQYQDATLSGGVNISSTVSGQAWFSPGDPNKFRYGERTVVPFALEDFSPSPGPGMGTTTAPHGITTTANTRFTRIYGVANDPGASTLTTAMPLPYIDVDGLASGIEVWVDATNVNLRYEADYSAFTSCYIVLEWVEDLL